MRHELVVMREQLAETELKLMQQQVELDRSEQSVEVLLEELPERFVPAPPSDPPASKLCRSLASARADVAGGEWQPTHSCERAEATTVVSESAVHPASPEA